MPEWLMYGLALLGAVVAGGINTLAGSGSLITLPILIFLGLPTHVANATNRVGVLIQSLVSITTLWRSGRLQLSGSVMLILPALVGAAFGAYAATRMKPDTMHSVIGVVLVIMFVLILLDPKHWLREESEEHATKMRPWLLVAMFGVGLYGGFLQAGMGVLLLVALVMGAGCSLLHANGLKFLMTICCNVLALAIFIERDLVAWKMGGLMAVGQSIGAWFAVRFLVDVEEAPKWTRRLLIVVLLLGIAKFWLL